MILSVGIKYSIHDQVYDQLLCYESSIVIDVIAAFLLPYHSTKSIPKLPFTFQFVYLHTHLLSFQVFD